MEAIKLHILDQLQASPWMFEDEAVRFLNTHGQNSPVSYKVSPRQLVHAAKTERVRAEKYKGSFRYDKLSIGVLAQKLGEGKLKPSREGGGHYIL